MKNITYIISDIDKAIAFEWIVKHIDSTKINLYYKIRLLMHMN